jgi:hypothetical protein
MTGVYGAQMGAQNQMALAAAQDYQRRDQMAQQALMTRGEYEDKAWMTNVYQPYAEEAQAASALAEAGKVNAYQAVKGLAGVGANALMMKSLGMFDTGTGTGTNKVAPTTSPTNADPNFISNFNPNFQGFNKYNQPQFKSITERVSSFVPNLGITSKPNPFVPMMGDANSTSVVPGQTTGIQFNPIPGVTDGLTESPMINQQPFNNIVNQVTGRNSFTVGTTNNGGVGALNVTPPVVSNAAPVQPTAVIPSQPAPAVPAPAIVSPGFAQAQQTMNAVEAGAIQPGTYTKDQMQAQDVAAAAAAAPSGDVKSSGDNTFTEADGDVWKSKEDHDNYNELYLQFAKANISGDKKLEDKLWAQLMELKKEALVIDAPTAPAPAEAAPATPAVVAPEAPAISKITPLQSTIQMVSRLPMDIIKSSPSLQKFTEQASTEPENGEVTMTYKSEELLGSTAQGNRRWEPFTKEVPLPMVNGVVDWRAAVNNYHNSEECKAGKCYSSQSAHGPGYFAIPMLGELIDQEGNYTDIDDLNEKKGTSLSPKDQKSAIEFLFKEDLSEDEVKWLQLATHAKGSLQGIKNQMKPKLKALKEEYPDLFGDIVDDEGNYIGNK